MGPPSSSSLNTQALSDELNISILIRGPPGTPSQSPASTFVDNDAAKAPQVPITATPTPPESRNTSLDSHAAEAPPVPLSELIPSPVNDPELPVTDAKTTTQPPLDSMKPWFNAINDHQATTAHVEDEPLNAALIKSSAVSGQGKGKGKDPELYDTDPIEDGNTTNGPADLSTEDNKAEYNAAEALVRLRNAEPEFEAASILLNMNAKPYNCKTCPEGIRMGCADCLGVPWRHSAHSPPRRSRYVSPSTESESEDEGPKRSFSISHHGNLLQCSVLEGNAVFALPSPVSQRNQETCLQHENGVVERRPYDVTQDSIHYYYFDGYRVLAYEEFEREDTVPLDDDDAGYDSEKYGTQMQSRIPKLSQKTLERLKAMKCEYKPDPNTLTEISSDTSVSVTGIEESVQPLPYAKESTTHGFVNLHATIDPEATASTSAPPSSQRSSYMNRRTRKSSPRGSVDLTNPISSPSPAHTRQARQMKAITSPPLKHIQTALKSDHKSPSPKQHNPPTAPVPKPPSATHIGRRKPRPTPDYLHYRANLPDNLARLDLPPSSPQAKQTGSAPTTKAGPSTPKKQRPNPIIITTTKAGPTTPQQQTPTPSIITTPTAPLLPTPTVTDRKRKADTQPAKGPSPAPPKRQKANPPPPPSRQPRTRAVMREGPSWYVDEEGDFVTKVPVDREFVETSRGGIRPRFYMGFWDKHHSGHWV